MENYSVDAVIKDAATIGEGPHWDEETQTLLYVDINNGDIHRWNPDTRKDEKIHLDNPVGFVVPRSKGGLVVGSNLSFASVDWNSGTVSPLATIGESSDNRLNDGKCDASGRLWAGTMMSNMFSPTAKNAGNLYSLEADGAMRKQLEGVTISNGIAWSGDNRTMFYIDSPTRQVWAFEFDLDQGTIANKRIVVDFATIPELTDKMILPDGMTIDTHDNLWVACINAGAVSKFDSKTGKLLQKVDVPGASLITSACWGGSDLDELYVTSMKMPGMNEEQKKREYQAGSVFRVTGLGAKGRPAYGYQG